MKTHPNIMYDSNKFVFNKPFNCYPFDRKFLFQFQARYFDDFSSERVSTESLSILTDEVNSEIKKGLIPDMEGICDDLYRTFFTKNVLNSALQFIPVLQQSISLAPTEISRFLNNPKTNHVLVQNELIKIVLIHWPPNKFSNIHGHVSGGCVFKVLAGSLEEKRYSTDESQRLLAVSRLQNNEMAYIDDSMGYHAVGNPFDIPAISLHVYTPGFR